MIREAVCVAFAPQLAQRLYPDTSAKIPDQDFFFVCPHCGHSQIS